MRASPILTALFPAVRQEILAATLLSPERSWYLSELAAHLKTSPSSLQRELARDSVLTVGAVGSAGAHLTWSRDLNRPDPGPGAIDPRRPYLSIFPSVSSIAWLESSGNSFFSSLQTSFEKRLSHGLYLLANWTWSHSLDNSYPEGGAPGPTPQDPKNRPILDLTWHYPTHGEEQEPSAEAVLAEMNGSDSAGQALAGYKLLKADGSTASIRASMWEWVMPRPPKPSRTTVPPSTTSRPTNSTASKRSTPPSS